MPLIEGHDPFTIASNIRQLRREGRPNDVAVSTALSMAERSRKKLGRKGGQTVRGGGNTK